MLLNIRIVLIETSHPGNIGAAARAMKVMGLSDLYLVNPSKFPDPVAKARSAGATDILDNAKICNSIGQAITNCHLVLATSARPRDLAIPLLTPREMGSFLDNFLAENSGQKTNIAIVFGREKTGLCNDELALADKHIMIPTSDNYRALNLAQAVQIVCYELRLINDKQPLTMPMGKNSPCNDPLISNSELEGLYLHMEKTLTAVNFLQANAPKKLMPRLQRFFNQRRLRRSEYQLWRGICKRILDLATRKCQHTE